MTAKDQEVVLLALQVVPKILLAILEALKLEKLIMMTRNQAPVEMAAAARIKALEEAILGQMEPVVDQEIKRHLIRQLGK